MNRNSKTTFSSDVKKRKKRNAKFRKEHNLDTCISVYDWIQNTVKHKSFFEDAIEKIDIIINVLIKKYRNQDEHTLFITTMDDLIDRKVLSADVYKKYPTLQDLYEFLTLYKQSIKDHVELMEKNKGLWKN